MDIDLAALASRMGPLIDSLPTDTRSIPKIKRVLADIDAIREIMRITTGIKLSQEQAFAVLSLIAPKAAPPPVAAK